MIKRWTFLALTFFAFNGYAQDFANVKLGKLDGGQVDLSSVIEWDGPVVVSFWATWCKPCIQELNAVSEELDDWKEETNVKFVAVSADDARTSSRIKPFVAAKGWEFDVFADPNGDAQRKLGVGNVPYTLLFDKGKLIWQHTGYSPGDEEELYEKLEECSAE